MNLLLFAILYVVIGWGIATYEYKVNKTSKDWRTFVLVLWPVLLSAWIIWTTYEKLFKLFGDK